MSRTAQRSQRDFIPFHKTGLKASAQLTLWSSQKHAGTPCPHGRILVLLTHSALLLACRPPTRAWPLPIATSPTTTLPSWAGHLFRGQHPACLGSSYVTSGRILTLSMPWYPRIRWGVTVPAPQGLGTSRVPGLGPGVLPLRRLACSELSTQQVLCGQPLG